VRRNIRTALGASIVPPIGEHDRRQFPARAGIEPEIADLARRSGKDPALVEAEVHATRANVFRLTGVPAKEADILKAVGLAIVGSDVSQEMRDAAAAARRGT
jgi:hypothetical protein